MPKRIRFLGGAVCALLALALGAPAAQAACAPRAVTQAFLPWGDKGFYAPVPGGDFEGGGAGWTLTGAASVVEDNESFFIGGSTHRRSLELRGGASAASPVLCAGKGFPNARAFASSLTGRGSLGVEILNVNAAGGTISTGAVSKVGATPGWAPTRELKVSQGRAAHHGGQIRLRITAPLGGTWRVDDVQLDPRLSR